MPEAQIPPGPFRRIMVCRTAMLASACLHGGQMGAQRETDCPALDPAPGDGAELQVLPKGQAAALS